MALSSAVDATVAPPAPNPAHGHDEQSGHSHSGHSHAAPVRPTSRRPEVRIGASVLRLSLLARLAIAGTLLAVLWTVVSLVVGSEP
ncbi:hypothetical protein [Xanthobacter versatilis]|uniref:Uncharacterized protein n=1 Tax=Xanthobacter autotrophicus (strain ATCC BAA-1158 / Py2) TaxID=78245 RepID=A7IPH9_XANP2|nr:hypothetical protein Xaut_4706 [Xanthobacter autotrophicus Py2]